MTDSAETSVDDPLYFPGTSIRVRRGDGKPGTSSSRYVDAGIVLDTYDDRLGRHVRYFSLERNEERHILESRVERDPWGFQRKAWASLNSAVDSLHVVWTWLILIGIFAVGICFLVGFWMEINSPGLYREVGALEFALLYGVGGLIAGFVLMLAYFWLAGVLKPNAPVTGGVAKSIGDFLLSAPILVGATYGLWVGWEAATIWVTVSDLATNGDYYDEQGVRVTGRLAAYESHISRIGNAYVTATICDSGPPCVRVFEWGDAGSTVSVGEEVTVYGTYHVVNRVGGYAFPNEIQARGISEVKPPN